MINVAPKLQRLSDMNTDYATNKNPNGKFRQGTVIEISGCELKAENGRFQLNAPFPSQGEGRAYFQWSRLGRGDRVLALSTSNLRGASSREVEAMLAAGQLRIVSEPELHPACCGCADCEARYAA